MNIRKLTCIECPIGCEIEVRLEEGKVISVIGHSCPRGKLYAESEVVCPKRVVTSTVKTTDNKLISVKTDKPIRKEEIFTVMKKINAVVCEPTVKIGDILLKNICDDANLVATSEF